VLADRYEGKRLNRPNDLVYKSDGSPYFTNPPFGLPRFHEAPRRELPDSGVFRWAGGALTLVSTDLSGPNGLAFSPDERLYVTNRDVRKKVVMRYEVRPDGGLANGCVFFDMGGAAGEEALDGMKVDQRGDLFVSGPGGVWVISGEGKHLGTIKAPELPANSAWGDEDGRTLHMTARTSLYRVRLGIPGMRPRRARERAHRSRVGATSRPPPS
jgi:gluconolactonase